MSEQLLDAAAVTSLSRLLDVGTGPGYVAAAAKARGANVVAVDVAAAMVELASRLYPRLDVRQADAYELPFQDGSFDAVVGNLLILHLGRPEQAAAEFARVLAPGGVLALTAWDVPEKSRFPGILIDAVATTKVKSLGTIPAGPDFFRFSAENEFETLFARCGLEHPQTQTIAFLVRVAYSYELWDGLLRGPVRASAQFTVQSQRIRDAFDALVEQHRGPDGIELPVSVKLAIANKPY